MAQQTLKKKEVSPVKRTKYKGAKKQDQDSPELNPSTTSMAYDCMCPRWIKMEAVLQGTEALRAAGPDYLPQHAGETQDNYNERLARATLFNITEITLDGLVGKPFSEPIKYSEDFNEKIAEMVLDNVDLEGNDINVFARKWFREGIGKAMAHVLVDFPRVTKEDDSGQPLQRTLADDRQERLRPYWLFIKPENLIFAHAEIVDGREVLTHVRIKEHIVEQVGFAEVCKTRIRVIEPGLQTIYEWVEVKNKKKGEWVQVDQFTYDLDYIPLVTFYAERDDFMEGKPPLLDLADLNIAHWQSTSDQRNVLTVARFPILAVSGGVDEDGKMEIGPKNFLSTPDPQGKFYYVEHSGAAIEAGRQDLKDLEEQMSNYGAEMLKKRPGNVTATAKALDSAEAVSPLQNMTIRFQDALNLALQYTADWMKIDEPGSFEINREFGTEELIGTDVEALNKARQNRDISRKTYLDEYVKRGILSEDFDPEEDSKELEEEMMEFNGEAESDLDPAQDDLEPDDDEDTDE